MEFIRGWCPENGLTRFYGHMLVWTPQRQDKSGSLLPEWLFRYDDAERYRRLRERIERQVRAYRDVDIVWDVVNEAIHCRRRGAWEQPGWTDEPIEDVVPYVRGAAPHRGDPGARARARSVLVFAGGDLGSLRGLRDEDRPPSLLH